MPPTEALTTESGISMVVLRPPRRLRTPSAYDVVALRVTRWPAVAAAARGGDVERRPVAELPPGLREVVEQMARGEKRRVWIPADLQGASGEAGAPMTTSSEGELRAYEVEIVDLIPGVPPPTPPDDLAAPPADALRTKNGVAYRLLAPAEAPGPRPRKGDDVELSYTVWRQDGTVVSRTTEPATTAVSGLPDGWAATVRRLREGERARIWVPNRLAASGSPEVVDIELLEVHRGGR